MHKNMIMAHGTRSDSFLSDTIFIILIVTLTIIILLFCLGLLCFCRRSTKHHISPSFDSSSYMKLNRHSVEMSKEKAQNNNPLKIHQPFISNPIKIDDKPIRLTTPDLHRTIKQIIPMNDKKLKKKRAGCCCSCCHRTKDRSSMTINARTRI